MERMKFYKNDVFRLTCPDVSEGEMIFILDEVHSDKIYYSVCFHSRRSERQACGITPGELEEFLSSGLRAGEKVERTRLCMQQEVVLREGSLVDCNFDKGLIESFDGSDILVRDGFHTWVKSFEFLEFWENFYLKPEEVVEGSENSSYSQGYLEGHSGLKWL
jgi:hypothetical protein